MSSSSSSVASSVGFNSGLNIDDLVNKLITADSKPITLMQDQIDTITKQQGLYKTAQDKVKDLLTSLQKLTKRDFDGSTIFDALTSTSTDATIATAKATGGASPQNISLEVKSLPSQTTATSTAGVGKFDNTTTLAQLGVTAGTFTIYANGSPYAITVATTDTMGQVFNAIAAAVPNTILNGTPGIVNGKVNIAYQNGPTNKLQFGSGGDTSNFLAKTNLLTAIDNGTNTVTASQGNTTIDTTQTMSAAAANLNTAVTDGTFTINNVTFDTTGKSLDQIMDEINNSTAKVTASFNKGINSFQLKAKDTGSSLISLASGSSNFLTAMNLVAGADTTSSQKAGTNAEFVLNGATLYATSTEVDETVTGLTGVTISLKQAKVGATIQLGIQKDVDGLKTAIKDVVDKYNTAISYIDTQTDAKNKAPLASENRLKSLRNQIRTLFTEQVGALSATGYDSLQQVGIGTAASAGTATPQLIFTESKFDAAMTAAPNTVKKLFIGQDLTGTLNNTAGDDNMEGALTRIDHLLTDTTYIDTLGNTSYGALYAGTGANDSGLFVSYKTSSGKRIDDLNKSIQKAQDRLDLKQKRLRAQFLAMDKLVGQYQSQGNALNGLISQLGANNKGG